MTVKVTKPAINLREKLSELESNNKDEARIGSLESDSIDVGTLEVDTISGDVAVSGDINFGDNDKVTFGAGSDLQIYHSGTTSIINENGTGNLALNTNGANIQFTKGFAENLATFNADGSCTFYYDNAVKLATTSTGIDVTGTATMDGLTVSTGDVIDLSGGSSGEYIDSSAGIMRLNSRGSVLLYLDTNNNDPSSNAEFTMYAGGTTGGTTDKKMTVTRGGDISFYEDTGTTAKFFWDASAERLGIGTSSPASQLEMSKAGGTSLRIKDTTSGYTTVIEQNSNTDTQIRANNPIALYTGGTERMRIDSSGNLLVGKTAAGTNTVGVQSSSNGLLAATRSGGTTLNLNRQTSDGEIIALQKDGTTVGSIGASSGNIGVLSASTGKLGTGTTYYYGWDDTRVYPLADNSKDLGLSSYRWKDLYLSGGVYLGGTGSANYLDDYESGTFTPSLDRATTSPTITYSSRSGSYVKIGDMVFVELSISISSISAAGSGTNYVTGLPFSGSGNAGITIRQGNALPVVTSSMEYLGYISGSTLVLTRLTDSLTSLPLNADFYNVSGAALQITIAYNV